MAIPLWRQYTRLSREDRDAILGRRRRRLDAAGDSQREILDAFLQDAREVRAAYRNRNSNNAPDSGSGLGEGFAESDILFNALPQNIQGRFSGNDIDASRRMLDQQLENTRNRIRRETANLTAAERNEELRRDNVVSRAASDLLQRIGNR